MNDNQLTLIDYLSILSFCISLQNLELNISQDDIQKQTMDIDKKVNDRIESALKEIHEHLSVQDSKLNILMNRMEEK